MSAVHETQNDVAGVGEGAKMATLYERVGGEAAVDARRLWMRL